jgi:hypothetical protein
VTSIPEGFNPTVGGDLYLRSVTSIPEGFNPTVGGYLYLGSVTSIPEGFNPTVGGGLYLSSGNRYIGKQMPEIVLEWQDGKYKKVDDIFCEFVNKNPRIVNGIEVFQLKKVNKKEFLFLAKQDSCYAHGSTLEKSIEDLKFKIMSDKLKKEPLKMDTVITRQYYRIITGACELGVDSWMNENKVTKEEITVRELLPILEKTNAYGLSNFKKVIQ